MLTWVGSPGKATLLTVRGVRFDLVRWNNIAGCRRVGPLTIHTRQSTGQIVCPLRRFKIGRRSLYLRISWGYGR